MPPSSSQTATIRPLQYRDLEELDRLAADAISVEGSSTKTAEQIQQLRQWFGPLKFASLFPNPFQHSFCVYVAEIEGRLCGMVQVSPFNRTRSTWRVDRVLVSHSACSSGPLAMDVGSQLLRHCFQAVWQARTWLIEADINDKDTLALYRLNGFQQLARMTYWSLAPELQTALAEHKPDLPNLLPVSNADASLLHQLDTGSMPPLVRQVFDRHIADFKTSLLGSMSNSLKHWVKHNEVVRGYVFEPQRKVAIGYFQLHLCRAEKGSHAAELTVNPAYTWLYPELFAQITRMTQTLPPQPIELASADYHPEREEFLEQVGATRIKHTLMMSRSVWHKVRESKFAALENLQLSDVLQGLQPNRKPVPGRFSFDSLPPRSPRPTPTERPATTDPPLSPPALDNPPQGLEG